MKNRIKLLLIPTIATMAMPLSSTTSCAKQYSQIVKDVVSEFQKITTIPRPCNDGKHLDLKGQQLEKIANYVKQEARSIGISDEDIHTTKEWNNVWFDVPANDDSLSTLEPLILQVHMDMVVAGMSSWEEKTSTPIIPEIDWKNGIIHSKDYKTSLGADDGLGLAIVLTFIKNNQYKHGPLRILCSTEEDAGMFGASYINSAAKTQDPQDGFIVTKYKDNTPISYLLNVDGEEDGKVYRSSMGSATYNFHKDFEITNEDELPYVYSLNVDGLKGGHSGVDMQLGRANADKLVMNFLYLVDGNDNHIQIHKLWHPRKDGEKVIDISYQRNQIVRNSQVIFRSDLSKTELDAKLETIVALWKNNQLYQGEDWDNVSIDLEEDQEYVTSQNYISKTDSQTIETLVGKEYDGTNNDCLRYGVYDLEDIGKEMPEVSANISPTSITFDVAHNSMVFDVTSQIRAKTNNYLVEDVIKYFEHTKGVFETYSDYNGNRVSSYPAWTPRQGQTNKALVLIQDAYDSINMKPKVLDVAGGAEVAFWADINENINETCMGPTIDNCHSEKETAHIDSIQHCVDVIAYMTSHLPRLNKW